MTTLLTATPVTVPTGTSFYPSSAGAVMPAGINNVRADIDTASMPTSNSLALHWEVQFTGDPTWHQLEQSGPFVGGSHPAKGGGTTTIFSDSISIPQSPYPTRYRVGVDNGPTPSPLTVSLTAFP